MKLIRDTKKRILNFDVKPNKILISDKSNAYMLYKVTETVYKYKKSDINGNLIEDDCVGSTSLQAITDNWHEWYIIVDKKEIFKYIV